MPLNYGQNFGRAGAAAGGGFLGGLGRMLEPLDYARQAAWNLPGKLGEGDFMGALPGLLGVGAGAGLLATGVGAPLAILGGSLLGGAAQGIGKAADEERFEAPTPNKLVEALGGDPESWGGWAAGMGLGMAGDPLTYGGGALGKLFGGRYGTRLEGLARAKGPQYEGGISKLLGEVPPRNASDAPNILRRQSEMAYGDFGKQLAGEVPQGTEWMAHGAEGIFGRVPGATSGTMIRGGPGALDLARQTLERAAPGIPELGEVLAQHPGPAPMPRVQSDLMLQAARSKAIGPYRVEQLPFVDIPASNDQKLIEQMLGGAGPDKQRLVNDILNGGVPEGLSVLAKERGLLAQDLLQYDPLGKRIGINPGNMGRTAEGNYLITDPGSLVGPHVSNYPAATPDAQGGPITNWLLKMLGSDKGVQREIEEALARGTAGHGEIHPQGMPLSLLHRKSTQDLVAREGQGPEIARRLGINPTDIPPTIPGGGPRAVPGKPPLSGVMDLDAIERAGANQPPLSGFSSAAQPGMSPVFNPASDMERAEEALLAQGKVGKVPMQGSPLTGGPGRNRVVPELPMSGHGSGGAMDALDLADMQMRDQLKGFGGGSNAVPMTGLRPELEDVLRNLPPEVQARFDKILSGGAIDQPADAARYIRGQQGPLSAITPGETPEDVLRRLIEQQAGGVAQPPVPPRPREVVPFAHYPRGLPLDPMNRAQLMLNQDELRRILQGFGSFPRPPLSGLSGSLPV